MMRYVVCYDIADNKRRKRVADSLDARGDRVQESVFEVSASKGVFLECLEELERNIDPKQDRLAVYSLCSSCDGKALYYGVTADAPRTGEEPIFLV